MSEFANEQTLEPHGLSRPHGSHGRQSKSTTRGLIAALFGCLFGLIGVFAFSVFFVPLAVLCGLIGLLRAGSIAVGGVALLAWLLAAAGFATSPTLLFMTGAALVAGSAGSPAQKISAPVRKPPTDNVAMKQIAQSDYWAAYAGIGEGGKWTCAMVSGTANGSGAQIVIEHQPGSPGVLIRAIDPLQIVGQVFKSRLHIALPMQPARSLEAASSGRETRTQFPASQLPQFLGAIAATQDFQITADKEPGRPWFISTIGLSEVVPPFNDCVRNGGKA